MERFEEVSKEVGEAEVSVHKAYVRRELHPIVLCSPFLYRTYTKPLGYAGDYEMVNMMLRNPYEGSSAFAKLLNFALLNTEPVVAHRNRIDYLVETLRRETPHGCASAKPGSSTSPADRRWRSSVSCANHEESDLAEIDLLDFNCGDAGIHPRTPRRGADVRRPARPRCVIFQRSVHQILRAATQGDSDEEFTDYDIVYCAGLFDYLSQRVCQRLVELFCTMAKPGGLVIVTNVASSNPRKAWMEYVMEWNLIYRSEEEMKDLIPAGLPVKRTNVRADATGVNLFLEIEFADA